MGTEAKKVMVGMSPGDVPLTFANTSHAYARLGYDPQVASRPLTLTPTLSLTLTLTLHPNPNPNPNDPQTTIEVGLKRFVEWFNSSEYSDEFANMEVQNGEAEMLRVSMHKAAPQYTDDVTLPRGAARCEQACEKDKASWADKCSYDTLHCASCIDCGVPGKPYP